MSTDKELLEMAARASGYARMIWRDETPYVSSSMNGDDFLAWNPLTDDGDALRLAVKLSQLDGGLALLLNSRLNSFGVMQCYTNESVVSPAENMHNDPYAATRRAIVRAAAEIGKTL